MKIKIITVGSTWWERFIRRWGVSFLIGEDILFDTFGDPGVFLRNVARYNIDLSKIKHIVISHDDWDHTSGLWYLINNRKDITVYICPGFNEEIKGRIQSFGVKVVEVNGLTLIRDGIYSTGQLYGESDGREIYEQSLIIETTRGLSIVCGCAHPGIEQITDAVTKRFNRSIYMVAGGLHLKDNSSQQIAKVIKFLRQHGVQKIAPMHCTGKKAEELLADEYKENFVFIKEGSEINI